MNGKQAKEEVVKYSKIFDEKGLVNSLEGNLSVLDRESGLLYITPTATRKAFLTENDIAIMKGDEQVGGDKRRSSEYLLHKVALESRPDCNAAVHVHSPYLTAYAFCNKGINLKCSTTFSILHDEIPCLPYGEPGSIDITNGLSDALKSGHDLVLLANHGLICVGETLEHACAVVEATEAVMQIYYLAQNVGEISNLPEDVLDHMKKAKRAK